MMTSPLAVLALMVIVGPAAAEPPALMTAQASGNDALRPTDGHRPPPVDDRDYCVGVRLHEAPMLYCASSILDPQSGNRYGPENLVDDNFATAWVEGVAGPGIGESITAVFDEELVIDGVEIANGYGKSQDIFDKNGRAREIVLVFSDGTERVFTLDDGGGYQWLVIEPAVRATWVQLGLASVYPGTTYQDTAISEFWVDFRP